MNKYEKALELLVFLSAKTTVDYSTWELSPEERDARIEAIDLMTRIMKEAQATFEYEQTPQVYRDAQKLFDKINGQHEDKEIYDGYCLRIVFRDIEYLVTYYDDRGQVSLEPEWAKDGQSELEFGLEDPEFAKISQIIIDTGLSRAY